MGPEALLRITQILISIGVTILALETLAARRLFSSAGLYAWQILSTTIDWTQTGIRGTVLNALLKYPRFLTLISLQLGAAFMLLSGRFPAFAMALVGVMLATHLLFLLRSQYGLDGSDQMTLLVLAALFVYYLHPTPGMLTIVFGFLTGQLFLSYLTSGIAKAVSPVWRSGAAIVGILDTEAYGSHAIASFLRKHVWAARAVCWCVLGYECCGPMLALIHPTLALAFIIVGVAMHLTIGIFMGLNVFVWSFTATYPALYYFAQRFSLLGRAW